MSSSAKGIYDLIVVGSGPAGQRAALQGAKAGKKVALVEKHGEVGGGCVHFGTLPSKSFRESVYRYSLGSRGSLGLENEHVGAGTASKAAPDMSRLLRRKERVVASEAQIILDQLRRNQIDVLTGQARLLGNGQVEVAGPKEKKIVTGQVLILAPGARPVAPAHLPIDGKLVHDSNTILSMTQLPKTMVVLGAGIIGCEYASMFSMAGTRVFLVDRRDEILASVDREIVASLAEHFKAQGMEILLKSEATGLKPRTKGIDVELSSGRRIATEAVLVALGRFGNTEDLGLDQVGVERDDRGLIRVDASFRTSVPGIYAVGDVIGPPALASTSMEQGRIACAHAFKIGTAADQSMSPLFPYGIYTIPEISMIGRTEEELKADDRDFVVGRSRYRELARGQIVGDRWGILKLLVERSSLKLLGVHVIGDNAADLIHIGQAVMALGGDVTYFIRNVFNYPTLAEAYKTAAFHAVNQINGVTTTR